MHRSLVVLGVASAVALGLAEPSAAVVEPPPPPVLVTGDVPDGAHITAVSVTIDPTDDVLADLEIGETAPPAFNPTAPTYISGTRFEVRLDPTTVPRTYMKSDGVVFVMVTVTRGGAESLTTMTSARAVADPITGDVAWIDALESSVAAAESGRTRVAGRLLPAVNGDPDGGGDVYEPEPETEDDGVEVRPREYDPIFDSTDRGDTPAGCGDRKLAERTRSTTIGTTYPVGGDKAAMSVSSSSGAEYGMAWSFRSPGGTFGEFKAGEAKYTRSGWGFDWDGSAASRSYRKGIVYAKFLRNCVRGCNDCYRFWKPIGETGGTGSNTGITRPDWGHCRHIDRGFWYRDDSDGHNYSYGGAVKFAEVIGIDLSISREYNSSQKVWYKSTTDRRMCGNDTYPAMAGKVMMKYAR